MIAGAAGWIHLVNRNNLLNRRTFTFFSEPADRFAQSAVFLHPSSLTVDINNMAAAVGSGAITITKIHVRCIHPDRFGINTTVGNEQIGWAILNLRQFISLSRVAYAVC